MMFYLGPSSMLALPWTVMIFLSMASTFCVRALATEVFPTEYRGTGTGTLALLETVGTALGLLLYTLLLGLLGSQPMALSIVAICCIGAVGVLVLLPETAQRELETLSEEGI